MRNPLSPSFVVVLMLASAGCGGKETMTAPEEGGTSNLGGQTQGGQTEVVSSGGHFVLGSTGGLSAAATIGGSPGSGGVFAIGGTMAATAGTPSAGGSLPANGGAFPSGGSRSTGGVRSTGGNSSSSTGGMPSGSSSYTGGRIATGGTFISGGATPTGGSASMAGSRATGGTTVTGGSTSAGGTAATAGSRATGGASATGGTVGGGGTTPAFPKKFCGNINTVNAVDPPGLNFAKHWDQITPENQGKWASVQASAAGAFNWTALDAIYAYADQNGIIFKENTFIWGAAQPSGQTAAGAVAWIQAFCERYPKTALIDVVYEPPPHTTPAYATALGQGETGTYPWITKSFKVARQYCGSAVLILNDYNNIEVASQESHFIDIVKDIKAAGAPIDAVGAEAHSASTLTAAELQANLATLSSETGLPVYITEFDVNKEDDTEQLAIYQAQFPVFWTTTYVRGITVWGWIYGRTWETSTGLVKGTAARPAIEWLMSYLGRPAPP